MDKDTLIPTPYNGIIPLEFLCVGADVFNAEGKPIKINKIEFIDKAESFNIYISDQEQFIVSEFDRWLVTSSYLERTSILTTKELFDFYQQKNKFTKLKIPLLFKPLDYRIDSVMPMDPYLFGLMLGGRLSCWEIKDILEENGYYLQLFNSHKPPKARFTLWKDKKFTIPSDGTRANMPDYLYVNIENRLAVLQGMIDSEAKIDKDFRVVFQIKNDPAKVEFLKALIASFGFHVHDKNYRRRIHTGIDYICSFQSYNGIQLSRILEKQNKTAPYRINQHNKFKQILHIIPSKKQVKHMQIEVNSKIGLYLIGPTATIISHCSRI